MKLKGIFSRQEMLIWLSSISTIMLTSVLFNCRSVLILAASLIGVTSLVFNAKGNPFGQFLMVVFSLMYGVISYTFRYYGEMVTYLGMTMPMAAFALYTWMKNPFQGNRAEVEVNDISRTESIFMLVLSLVVTVVFYYILRAFHTANLALSTLSVTTSFLAVYLTFRRSALFAVAYAANDVVLVILWVLAAQTNQTYWSVAACFAVFFINDLYGYIRWKKMRKHQHEILASAG